MSTRICATLLSFLGLFLVYSPSFAQQAKMICNINQLSNTRQNSSLILNSIEFNNKSIHVQYSIYGDELWEYDGINPPTLIMDINPGVEDGILAEFIIFDNKVFFAGNNGVDGYELWAYDGINLPYMVADLNTNGNSIPSKFTVFQNKLYFIASTSTHNNLVWEYDGTNPPSHPPYLNFPNNNSSSDEFIVFDNQLFCTRYKSTTGRELYRYNGTNAPILVQDINSGAASSSPRNFTIYDNKLFFTAKNGLLGEELWMYDGTQAALVADIKAGSSSAFSGENDCIVYNNQLIFAANDGISGKELWTYDGTQVSLLNDLAPGAKSANPHGLTVLNNQLYFSCSQAGLSYLWAYNGTTSEIINTEIASPRLFSTFQGKLLFQGYYSYSIDGVLHWAWGGFIYDQSSEPQFIDKKRQTTDQSSQVKNLAVYKNMLYFSARNEEGDTKLWSFNGIAEGINSSRTVQNNSMSNIRNLIVHKDKLYFSGQVDDKNGKIWQYDGLNKPTPLPYSFHVAYPYTLNPLGSFCVYQDQLFFTGNKVDYSNSYFNAFQLYALNDSQLSVIIGDSILDIQSAPRDLTVYKGALYFVLNNYGNGEEIWKYDGTTLNRLTNVSSNSSSNTAKNILDLIIFNDKLYFHANSLTGRKLWCYDGINPPFIESKVSNISGTKSEFTVFQNKLYYVGTESQTGYELWSYDGSNPSSLVADLTTNPLENSFPNNFVVLKDHLYFSAFSEATGTELWAYDGSNPPKLIADIAESVLSSSPSDLTVFNDKLYFSADDGIHGIELWEYNPDTTQQLIIETPNDLQAILYPNPSKGRITINFEYLCQKPRVRVVNTNGQIVLDKTFGSTDQIELQLDRANTVYFIRVESADGQCLHRKVVMN